MSDPPGIVLLTSVTLKKMVEGEVLMSNMVSAGANECLRLKRCLRYRPWVHYSKLGDSSDEESTDRQPHQHLPPRLCLPKGVLHGCFKCTNFEKVTPKWCPEDAERCQLKTFYTRPS
ncbi:putative lysine-specific demethylase JMJ16 isoform X1 [Papaver somniferum]|uniref:putative lysine-specific demethylase JMJ16 isoform X1 n=1 Tax=Papaver somniferum TaxID=3469 RepID=UPI000E6FA984|nr:putative lysine-specific demethylase JMJ16 isoform X1 [Papaver somniferum]